MNPILLCFADGTSFFVGLAMTLVADLLILRFRVGRVRSILNVLAVTGIIFVVISATPLPLWAYALWLIAATAALVAGNMATSTRNVRFVLAGLAAAATVAFALAELPHRQMPHIDVSPRTTIYVLGDSISAGMGTGHKCWPAVLADTTGLSVVSLAQPGATVRGALKQSYGVVEPGAVVIVEIGGIDVLEGTDPAIFAEQLEMLVSSLRARNHRVLLIELPLYPFKNAFGMAQRRIAAKYNVAVLPKRCFTKVLGTKNGTLDGLHLSQEGHDAMAGIIAEVLRKE